MPVNARASFARWARLGLFFAVGPVLVAGGCSAVSGLSGDWTFAIALEDKTVAGTISLTQDLEERLAGTGVLAYADESYPVFVEGTLSEDRETVNLDVADGLVLRGDVSDDGEHLRGYTGIEGAEQSGTFSAVRVSDDGASRAGSGERREQVEAAVSDYLEAHDHAPDTEGSELRSRIESAVVAPVYWSSPGGADIREVPGDLDQAEQTLTANHELKEFVPHEEDGSGVTGTIRYTVDYRAGEETGTYKAAKILWVIRWGDEWRVLWASSAVGDPWESLRGTWDVSLESIEDSELNSSEFTLNVDAIHPPEDDPSIFVIEGDAEGVFGDEAYAGGFIPTDGKDQEDITIGFFPDGEGSNPELRLYDIEVGDDGRMEGKANFATRTSSSVTDFEAERHYE